MGSIGNIDREGFAEMSQERGAQTMLAALAVTLALGKARFKRGRLTGDGIYQLGALCAALAVEAEDIDRVSYADLFDQIEHAYGELMAAHRLSVLLQAELGL